MKDISLKDISEEHLIGEWLVYRRTLSNSNPSHIFAIADNHVFLPQGIYKILNGRETSGNWSIDKSDEIIKNPIVNFAFDAFDFKAIITRLLRNEDGKESQLTIYLSTGLELVLVKKYKV